jgi:hypothetical protein
MEADAWAWTGVSSLISLMFQIEEPERIEGLSWIEGMDPGSSWMLKRKGGGYSNKKGKSKITPNSWINGIKTGKNLKPRCDLYSSLQGETSAGPSGPGYLLLSSDHIQ